MKTFNILVPIQSHYSYDIQAESLEEALEMIASGDVDYSDMKEGDMFLDEAIAYELTPQGYYPVQA